MNALDIIMPVRNEGVNIVDTLKELKRSVKTPFRLLVCYDFDEDDTLPAIAGYAHDLDVVPVKNRGTGVHGAIMTGLAASTAPAVLMFPADEAYNIGIIDEMYRKFEEGNDVVAASRLTKGGYMRGGPLLKSLVVRVAAFTLRHIVGLPASDASYALRLFSRRLIDTVSIESTAGFTFAIELLVKCHRLGWHIAEVPARWLVREKGESHFNFKKWLPYYARWFFYAVGTNYLRKGPETVTLKSGAKSD